MNLMGAALFARLFSHTGEDKHREYAIRAARHSVRSQREDGSWLYGENFNHRWVGNFHTGFNLVALHEVLEDPGTGAVVIATRHDERGPLTVAAFLTGVRRGEPEIAATSQFETTPARLESLRTGQPQSIDTRAALEDQ